MLYCVFFFFFQAEDGIRDRDVTGVQTCALPILFQGQGQIEQQDALCGRAHLHGLAIDRSEERRVGKGVDLGGRRIIKKKKRKRMKKKNISCKIKTKIKEMKEYS